MYTLLLNFKYIMYFPLCLDISPDPRSCKPDTTGVCHADASCVPFTPDVCPTAHHPMSYWCECNQGYHGDGLKCKG